MKQSEIIAFIIIANIILIIFIVGIIQFIIQYRKRKIEHMQATDLLNEQHTQELLEKQLDTQQQTMQHIGREIHDNVGQKLTLASLYTKQLSIQANKNQDEKIVAIGNMIDESLNELRLLSKTLTNPQLANAGLCFLLQEEAKRINLSGVCYVKVDCNESEISITQATKNILFRLLQEFIQNSLKHAGCKKITIDIQSQSNQIKITATDDGKGFDTQAPYTGIGLQNMQRRAEEIGAVYQLISHAGKGTTLILSITNHK